MHPPIFAVSVKNMATNTYIIVKTFLFWQVWSPVENSKSVHLVFVVIFDERFLAKLWEPSKILSPLMLSKQLLTVFSIFITLQYLYVEVNFVDLWLLDVDIWKFLILTLAIFAWRSLKNRPMGRRVKLYAILSYQNTRALYFSEESLVLISGVYEYFDTSVNELWLLLRWQWKGQNMWRFSVSELHQITTKWHALCASSNNISNDRVAYGVRTLVFSELAGPKTSMDKIESGSTMLVNKERLYEYMLGR